jgi:hypothetical protein
MKLAQILLGCSLGFVLGAWGGYRFAALRAETALIAGPASDNYPPALAAISEAKAKLASGDTNVIEQLQAAQNQIEKAQEWTRRFLGQPEGGANGSQPFGPETNRTPSAAGSRRSP